MRRFLLQVSVFVLILTIVSVTLSSLVQWPKLYGNGDFRVKLDSVKNPLKKFNHFFFGSSRIATGLNPDVFDSTMLLYGYSTRSFNMATYGTWFSEGEYLLDQFAKNTSTQHGVVFIEFNNVMSIDWNKIDKDKNLYYQNSDNWRFILEYLISNSTQSPREFLVSLHYLGAYGLSAALTTLNLGKSDCLYSDQIEYRGFGKGGYKGLIARDTTRLRPISYKVSIDEAFETMNMTNNVFLNKVLERIDKGKSQGIYYYYILTPKNYTPEMAAVYAKIPVENRMDFQNFLSCEALYDKSLWADVAHLNENGARAYTQLVAEDYAKKIAPHLRTKNSDSED